MPYQIQRFGWLPDPPDWRDFRPAEPVVARAVAHTAAQTDRIAAKAPKPKAKSSVDLRPHDTPIEDQGNLGSCTAHAVTGLMEYMEMSLYGRYLHASRRFLYKATRSFLGWTGDTGAFVRSTIKSLRLFGACPEEYWPYDEKQFDVEPPAFCYAFAADYKALTYYRLNTLDELKQSLVQGLPFAFGFTVFESIRRPEVTRTGRIPMPGKNERQIGGHAIMCLGYDDKTGDFLIRNSWGTGWGEEGYGWLPYEYVTKGLAQDFWVLAKTAYEDLEGAR